MNPFGGEEKEEGNRAGVIGQGTTSTSPCWPSRPACWWGPGRVWAAEGGCARGPPSKEMDPAERLLRILEDLSEQQLHTFTFYLGSLSSLPSHIPRGRLSGATRVQVAQLLAQHYPGQELEVAAQVLRKIPRMDLLESYGLPGEARKTGGEPPGLNAAPTATSWQPRQVSDKELMMLGRNMGKNWKQIGIEFLGAKMSRLEQIEEENQNNVAMRAFYVLVDWRNRERERATAAQLYVILNQKGVPLDHEAYAFLIENV